MEGSVANNFAEGKSNEQVREVGHHARKAGNLANRTVGKVSKAVPILAL
jgi:hypothetical protein